MTTCVIPGDGEFVEFGHPEARGRLFRKHALSVGSFAHPNGSGNRVSVTPEVLSTIVKNFESGVCSPAVQMADGKNTHSEDPRLGVGQVVGLEVEDGKLFTYLDVRDPDIADRIADGRILGSSAFLNLNYAGQDGRRVGPAILHQCLTQRPYLTDLEPFEEIKATMGLDGDLVPLTAVDDEDDVQLADEWTDPDGTTWWAADEDEPGDGEPEDGDSELSYGWDEDEVAMAGKPVSTRPQQHQTHLHALMRGAHSHSMPHLGVHAEVHHEHSGTAGRTHAEHQAAVRTGSMHSAARSGASSRRSGSRPAGGHPGPVQHRGTQGHVGATSVRDECYAAALELGLTAQQLEDHAHRLSGYDGYSPSDMELVNAVANLKTVGDSVGFTASEVVQATTAEMDPMDVDLEVSRLMLGPNAKLFDSRKSFTSRPAYSAVAASVPRSELEVAFARAQQARWQDEPDRIAQTAAEGFYGSALKHSSIALAARPVDDHGYSHAPTGEEVVDLPIHPRSLEGKAGADLRARLRGRKTSPAAPRAPKPSEDDDLATRQPKRGGDVHPEVERLLDQWNPQWRLAHKNYQWSGVLGSGPKAA